MKSTTLQAAYDLGKFCAACLLGFIVLAVVGVEGSALGEYVMLVSICIGGLTTVLGLYAGRTLPFANRAPTSAELAHSVGKAAPAPTIMPTEP